MSTSIAVFKDFCPGCGGARYWNLTHGCATAPPTNIFRLGFVTPEMQRNSIDYINSVLEYEAKRRLTWKS